MGRAPGPQPSGIPSLIPTHPGCPAPGLPAKVGARTLHLPLQLCLTHTCQSTPPPGSLTRQRSPERPRQWRPKRGALDRREAALPGLTYSLSLALPFRTPVGTAGQLTPDAICTGLAQALV